jgi:hypothetical protein
VFLCIRWLITGFRYLWGWRLSQRLRVARHGGSSAGKTISDMRKAAQTSAHFSPKIIFLGRREVRTDAMMEIELRKQRVELFLTENIRTKNSPSHPAYGNRLQMQCFWKSRSPMTGTWAAYYLNCARFPGNDTIKFFMFKHEIHLKLFGMAIL